VKGKAKPCPFMIIVDTREQKPFEFRGIDDHRGHVLEVATTRRKLDAGDYSILGLEQEIAVERKTKPDMYGTAGKGRDRFEREIELLAAMAAPAIVIQCDGPSRQGAAEDEKEQMGEKGKREQEKESVTPPCCKPGRQCPILELLIPPPHTGMSPKSVVNSLFAWSVRRRIPVWLCPDRRSAETLTFRLLQHFWNRRERQRKEGCRVEC
jgi:hypothetical protein